VESSPPYRIASRVSAPRLPARPYRGRVRDPPRDHTDEGRVHVPPLWHDGTERPIHRPPDPEDQPESDSGKKKSPTLTNLLVINEASRVCFWSESSEGQVPDKSLADLAGYTWPAGRGLYQDLGCQGFVLAGVTIVQPQNKPRGGELTPPEQATNHRIASISIRIEQAIGGVKR
jgi:hypothetical protein